MKRPLLTLLAVLSLLLFVCTVAITIRSFVVADGWSWSDGIRVDTAGYRIAWRKSVIVERGRVYCIADRAMGSVSAFSARLTPDMATFGTQLFATSPAAFRCLGFEHEVRMGYAFIANVRHPPPVDVTRIWVVPLWPILIFTMILPVWWVIGLWRARRRGDAMCCVQCGYDLRASPDRCPECGTAVSSS